MNEQVDNAIGGYEDCHPVNQVVVPKYTREELVQIMAKEFHQADENGLPLEKCWGAALDALIATGAVRVK